MAGNELDMLNRIIVCMGSNRNPAANVECAGRLLCDYFISPRFSVPVYTEPIGAGLSGLFLNQIIIAYTADQPDEVIRVLKQIERQVGRTPQDKLHGDIPIDIDLLQWNDLILKPDDLRREYVISGICSLSVSAR